MGTCESLKDFYYLAYRARQVFTHKSKDLQERGNKMNMKREVLIFCITSINLFCCSNEEHNTTANRPSKKHSNQVLSDTAEVLKIAEQTWLSKYGNKVYDYKPFIIKSENNDSVWHIYGTLKNPDLEIRGGEPHILIDKYEGKILKVYHTK